METLLALLPHEEWRDIIGYEGKYQISNLGNVKSFIKRKPIILKPSIHFKYKVVHLFIESKNRKAFSLHGLTATAFIPNPDNKPEVNHIDGIKTHNWVWNLEWATRAENTQHAIDTGLQKFTDEKISKYLVSRGCKPISVHINNEFIGIFERKTDVAKLLSRNPTTVYYYLIGKIKMPKGVILQEVPN